jgi:dTDP-4-dehydrorhamnose 3,5-epimerase
MNIIRTAFSGVVLIEPKVYEDTRGFFYESYNQRTFTALTGVKCSFVQDNHSRSEKHVLRGLHYQLKYPQGKLVRVIAGEIFDVVVDLRTGSSDFGRWTAFRLSETNRQQLWVPVGFAHGFLVLSDYAEVLYKTTDFYAPEYERCILWRDAQLAIDWPLLDGQCPRLSEKDSTGLAFIDADYF